MITSLYKRHKEMKKKRRKEFGSWSAFFFGFFLFCTFGFWGILLNVLGSGFLYGIPLYLAFPALVTYTVYLSQRFNKVAEDDPDNYERVASYFVVSAGLSILLLQMVMGYLNEYWLEHPVAGGSLELVLAITLMDEVAAFMRSVCPGYPENRRRYGFVKRTGIRVLALAGLVPVLAGWALGHVVVSAWLSQHAGLALCIFMFISLGFLSWFLSEQYKLWGTGILSRQLVLSLCGVFAALGLVNGAMTGGGPVAGDIISSDMVMKIMLYGLLASEILAVLTMTYIFILLPRYFGNPRHRI